MKKLARPAALVLCAALLFALTACGTAPAKKQEKTLYDHGLELIALIDEMAGSEEYLALYSASEELNEIVTGVAQGDFTSPKAVYKLTAGGDSPLWLTEEDEAFNALPETLRELVRSRLLSALVTQINAMAGSTTLAASSICTAGKTFVSTELTENMVYIYTFENAVPVAVTFTMGEDSAVSASACFIFNDGVDGGIGEFSQLLGELGLKIEEIELK